MTSLSENQDYQIYYEHTFTNYEHTNGTNEYSFKYPDHWIQYPSQQHLAALRSITIEPSAREITFNNIKLKRDDLQNNSLLELNLNMSIPLAYGDDMNVLNSKIREQIDYKYTEYKNEVNEARVSTPNTPSYLGCNDYTFCYDQSSNCFVMKILTKAGISNPYYFYFQDFADQAEYTSSDFKAIVGIKDDSLFVAISKYQNAVMTKTELLSFVSHNFPTIKLGWNDALITEVIFTNVWNRSRLLVSSSLSTLSENRFLTLTNTYHNPPKLYDVKGYNGKFSIYLYNASSKAEIELPKDGADSIVIEMILIAK
jgi:hypothetical protein